MKTTFLRVITAVLILLFIYTAAAKLSNISKFESELINQTIPKASVPLLLWLIPLAEIFIACLLALRPTRKMGFYGSALLMSLFTGYMGSVLLNFFDRVPCSCGGVLKSMSFEVHFIFNFFFLLLSTAGIWLLSVKSSDQRIV